MSKNPYDFVGWATRYGIKCSDGRTLLHGAFSDCDGKEVPLVWNHDHNDPMHILGKALLKHTDEGVQAFCSFNDTEGGQTAKKVVQHGDVASLSIYANKLQEKAHEVRHGVIREVSLVLSGANPGAFIDKLSIAHSEEGEETIEEAIIYHGDSEGIEILESSEEEHAEVKGVNDMSKELNHSEDETVEDVFARVEQQVSPEDMDVIYGAIAQAAGMSEDDDEEDDEYEEDDDVKHNAFDMDDVQETNFLSHSDEGEIIELAKKTGKFKDALEYFAEENGKEIMHADPAWGPATVGGFDQNTEHTGNVTWMFPEYHDVNPSRPPEMITKDWSWQEKVLSKCHKLPFARIRTNYLDLREVEETAAMRAKGYPVKGAFKKYSGNFNAARRTTDPQTVYVKNALNRDDIADITDFDYVNYLYQIDKRMLTNELAGAILFGDGRADGAEDKIYEDKIRPIWTDDDLYTIKATLDLAEVKSRLQGTDTAQYFSDNYVLAEAFIEKLLYTRERFKGSGSPDLYITPHMINIMLLSRDRNGRRIYSSAEELRAALNVNSIITVEQMATKTRTVGSGSSAKTMQLDAILVNLQDYAIGSTKKGEVTHFQQFDIDFNQEKSLIETRLSGALTKVFSAIVIEEEVTSNVINPEG